MRCTLGRAISSTSTKTSISPTFAASRTPTPTRWSTRRSTPNGYVGVALVRGAVGAPRRRHLQERGDRLPPGRARIDAAAPRRPSLRVPRVRLHAPLRGRVARGRDDRNDRTAAAPAPPLAVSAHRRVLRHSYSRARSSTTISSGGRSSGARSRTTRSYPRRGWWCSRSSWGSRRAGSSSGSTTSTWRGPVVSCSAPAACAPRDVITARGLESCCASAARDVRARRRHRPRTDLRRVRRQPACRARRATRGRPRASVRSW